MTKIDILANYNIGLIKKGDILLMVIKELINLKQEFERIRKMGYVESTRTGFTGIGKTFEDLIGKSEDTLKTPDYHGIEIKTKKGYSKSYTTFFNVTPKGNSEFEIKRLCNAYGYPDKVLKNKKVLAVSIMANYPTLVANRFLFKLDIDYDNEKMFLSIRDKNMKFLEKNTYWEFEDIKERLENKLSFLAYIKAWPNNIGGKEYYKYYDIQFYQLRDFQEFLKLMEEGKIRITFKIGIFREGNRKGEIHDRGTGFEIKEENLEKLFRKIKI